MIDPETVLVFIPDKAGTLRIAGVEDLVTAFHDCADLDEAINNASIDSVMGVPKGPLREQILRVLEFNHTGDLEAFWNDPTTE